MNKVKILFWLLIIIFFLISFYPYITHFSRIITINNVTYFRENGIGRNLFSDTEGNVYEVSNTNYYLFYRSAEVFSKLKSGIKLKIYGYGIRIPFFNIYPKIIGIKPYR